MLFTRKSIETAIDGFSLSEIIGLAKRKMLFLHAKWHEILENAREEEGTVNRNFKYFTYVNKLLLKLNSPVTNILKITKLTCPAWRSYKF